MYSHLCFQDVDSDEEALPPKKKKKKKKAKLVRAAIDQHKADGLTNGMRAMMSSDAIVSTAV